VRAIASRNFVNDEIVEPAMILRQFPGNEAAPRRGRDDFSCFHRRNVIVHARSRQVAYAEHTAPLSIKTTLRGREVYAVGTATLAVEEGVYLVLNNEQPYASCIEATEAVESFCLFFRDDVAREVWCAQTWPTARLLDDPQGARSRPDPFFQTLRRRDDLVTPLLARLHAEIAAGMEEPLWLDERFHELMEALLRVQQDMRAEMEALSAVRAATRQELYRRLLRARDYLESFYHRPLGIAELARAACLSPHHFLRLFKQAFQCSPHQYLTRVRLEHARYLLAERGCPVTEACLSAGFENASSFARLFKRHYGLTPQQIRRPAK
jgi:AraC family transcriptional regulator